MELHTVSVTIDNQVVEVIPLERINAAIKIDYATGVVTIRQESRVFRDGFEGVQTNEGSEVGSSQAGKSEVSVPHEPKA